MGKIEFVLRISEEPFLGRFGVKQIASCSGCQLHTRPCVPLWQRPYCGASLDRQTESSDYRHIYLCANVRLGQSHKGKNTDRGSSDLRHRMDSQVDTIVSEGRAASIFWIEFILPSTQTEHVWEQGTEGREEVAGKWRKLLSEKFHSLCCPLNIVKVNMGWAM
jgi:hypothetical protein